MTDEFLDKSTESIEQILLYADFGMGVTNQIKQLKCFFDNSFEFLYNNEFEYFEHLCYEFDIRELNLTLQELDEFGFKLNQIMHRFD